MSGQIPGGCSMGCPEGGPDRNRQHVWDLQHGMRGSPVVHPGVIPDYTSSAPREPGKPRERESVTLTRPRGERS
jgi:hypothetical protein